MRLLVLLLVGATYGQVAQKAATYKVHAGASYCTFINYKPMALTGLHIECGSATTTMALDAVIAVGGNGLGGQFLDGRDSVSWTFQRSTAEGPLMYKVTANGKSETGLL